MNFADAVRTCHVSGSIYRVANPSKKYAKNHSIPLKQRVPEKEQLHDDWEEYDPEEFGHY